MRSALLLPLRMLLIGAPLLAAASAPALSFNLVFNAGTPMAAQNSFNAAAARWSALLTDPITVNFNVGLASLPSGVIGGATPDNVAVSYGSFRTALAGDASTANDALAVAGLQTGPNLAITTNYLSDNPNSNRATSYTATVANLALSRANAKAVGLLGASADRDARIEFATAFQSEYDYDPSDGIGSNRLDFTGVATHEIGHALGFFSGVDTVDFFSDQNAPSSTQFAFVSPLDLFRRGGISTDPNLVASNSDKYFSFDNGATSLTRFATGQKRGDGDQASHWRDDLGLGIMDPTAADGEFLAINANDLRAFDAIGYNAVPEPATLAALGLGALALLKRRRRA